MPSIIENKFWQFETNYWLKKLNNSGLGLSQALADKILHEKGLHSKSKSALKKDILLFANQFKSPLILLLVAAVIISTFLGDSSEAIIILFIILSTGLLSFFQERKAGKVAQKLQSLLSIKVTVLRDGHPRELPSKQVVPGDIIILNAGDMLPADCLIMKSDELYANQATLTGESFPAKKTSGCTG